MVFLNINNLKINLLYFVHLQCMIVQMDVSVHWNDSFKILDDKIPLIFSASPGLSKKVCSLIFME